MTTSGSTDYNLTRNQIIEGALRLCGVLGRGKSMSAEDENDTAQALELMIKSLQARGVKLWKIEEAVLFIEKGTASYSLSGAHCTRSYVSTTLLSNAPSGQGFVTVTSSTGISAADFIGIELDDGTMQWTTVSSVGGLVVNLNDTLTAAASAGKTVYAYTTKVERPLRLIDGRRVISGQEIPVDVISREEYFRLPNKTSSGYVNEVYYDPQLTGKLYIWPTGQQADDILKLDFRFPIQDFDTASTTPDFPQEWIEPLKFSLASRIGPEYGLKIEKQMYLDTRAETLLREIMDFDEEFASIYIGVNSG